MKARFFLVGALLIGLVSYAGLAETFVVGSDIPWKPFEMITADGEFFGFDLDLLRAVAVTAGFEIEIQNVAFDAIIEEVRAGRLHIGASGFTITAVHLALTARVPGADQATFEAAANNAKTGCPISRALNAPITLDATLET